MPRLRCVFVPRPGESARGDTPLPGAFLLSVALHLTLFGLALGSLGSQHQPRRIWSSVTEFPVRERRPLSEFDVSYDFPSEIPLGKKKRAKKKALIAVEAGEGLGNAATGGA